MLELVPARGHPPKCTMGAVLRRATPDDRKVIEGWLADEDIQHIRIAASIPAEYGKVSGGTVGRHRLGQCSCGDN